MKAQATCPESRDVPAVATLAPRAQVACATCHGTGTLGSKHELRDLGTSTLVLTQTQWCAACAGLGKLRVES